MTLAVRVEELCSVMGVLSLNARHLSTLEDIIMNEKRWIPSIVCRKWKIFMRLLIMNMSILRAFPTGSEEDFQPRLFSV